MRQAGDDELCGDVAESEVAAGDADPAEQYPGEKGRHKISKGCQRSYRDSQAEFQQTEKARQGILPVHPFGDPFTSIEDAKQEARQHDGEGIYGGAEHLDQDPHPDNFQRQCRHAGQGDGNQCGFAQCGIVAPFG